MKSRNKRSPKKQQQIRPEIEELEERIAPGLLTVRPPSLTTLPNGDLADSAMHGLNTAEARTNGVINWTPSA